MKLQKRKFFNKIFYEISNIKAYQPETASQRSTSQNSPSCCAQIVCLQKDDFGF